MLADLLRAGLADPRVPPADELLDAGHVDRAVVQVVLDRRQVGGEEPAVGADRVATERHGARLGRVLADELERRRAGIVERRRGADRLEQTGTRVHLDDHRVHRDEELVGLVDHEIGTLGDDREIVVGDDGGDLDDDVAGVVQPRHLEIHPDQHAVDTTGGTMAMGPERRRCVQHAARRAGGPRDDAMFLRRRFGFMAFHGGALEKQTDVIAAPPPRRPARRCTTVPIPRPTRRTSRRSTCTATGRRWPSSWTTSTWS